MPKFETKNIENRQAVLTIEVEPERLEKSQQEAARRIAQKTNIPGFRAGKAPYPVVEQAVGKQVIFDEALETLSREVYRQALDETGLVPIDVAQVEIAERPPAGGVTLKMTVPLQPKVELGDYRKVRVEPHSVKVEDAEVEKVLESMREDQAPLVPVERPAQNTDLLVLDIDGRVGEQPVIDVKGGNYTLNLGSAVPVAGFPELIEGMKVGETREFDRTYPADFADEDLAGHTVHFRVTVHGIKEKQLPPLNDEFAKNFGDYPTLEALRAKIRELLEEQAKTQEEERIADETLKAIAAQADVEYPPVLLQRELDQYLADFAHSLSHQGFTLQRYLEVSGKSLAALRTDLLPRAEERLKRSLVLSRIAETEGIAVDEGEVTQEIEELSTPYGDQKEAIKRALSQPDPQQEVRSRLLGRKVIQRLIAIGRGESEPKSKQ